MSDLFLLSERQMARLSPFSPLSHGAPCVDDRPEAHFLLGHCAISRLHPPELCRQKRTSYLRPQRQLFTADGAFIVELIGIFSESSVLVNFERQ